jgi:hypothetical protein|tara:strand:- start:908 stop:1144 length:237 start_codon:yes stop_codon:yes gene_type:complete
MSSITETFKIIDGEILEKEPNTKPAICGRRSGFIWKKATENTKTSIIINLQQENERLRDALRDMEAKNTLREIMEYED